MADNTNATPAPEFKKSIYTRFIAGDGSTAIVYRRTGSKGYNVATSVKGTDGSKAVTYSRFTIALDAENALPLADAEYNRQREVAASKNWTEKVRPVRVARVPKDRSAFAEIPEAPAAPPQPEGDAPAAEAAPAPKAGRKNGKKAPAAA